jgi:hypothetical protein
MPACRWRGAALLLATVGLIAERHPGLKQIANHMAVPPRSRGEAAYRFQPELLTLAKYPNVSVKATGQPDSRAAILRWLWAKPCAIGWVGAFPAERGWL